MPKQNLTPDQELARRDRIVQARVQQRLRLVDIGKQEGLSRERVRQILHDAGIRRDEEGYATRKRLPQILAKTHLAVTTTGTAVPQAVPEVKATADAVVATPARPNFSYASLTD